jgi:acetyl esterase
MKKTIVLISFTFSVLLSFARFNPGDDKIPSDTGTVKTEIYKTVGKTDLSMKFYYPTVRDQSKPIPAIAFFFGGGWVGGNIDQFKPQAAYLASRGMIAILVDYRVKSRHQTTPFEAVMDAKSAIRYLRLNAKRLGIDSKRIAAAGGSAGGHLAAVTGNIAGLEQPGEDLSVSSKPDALLLFNPVIDNGPGGFGFEACGGESRYREISPIHNIRKGAPPTIVFLGDNDRLIPTATAVHYKKLMAEAGSRCDIHLYKGQEHGFFNFGRKEGKFLQTLYQADLFLSDLGFLKGMPSIKKPEE